MKDAILQLIDRAAPQRLDDYDTVLKEIIQRICLLGLWRARFFEHAAFYGGSSLRLLHGLDRFSEDLEFSLLHPDPAFKWRRFFSALKKELQGFGFDAEVTEKRSADNTPIAAEFIKSNTSLHFLRVGVPEKLIRQVPVNQVLKIKVEVDTDPPPGFGTEIRYILQPVPFSVRAFAPQDLFAGKMHAVLFRRWGRRIKGRDWYDLVWFAQRQIPLNLAHLAARMKQAGNLSPGQALTESGWREQLFQVVRDLDVEAAKMDVRPFLRDASQLDLWSSAFFRAVAEMIPTTGA